MVHYISIEDFLDSITIKAHREKMRNLLNWVSDTWPELKLELKWNQPIFTDHGTYIIGFSIYPKNIAIAPEAQLIERLRPRIEATGCTTTMKLIRLPCNVKADQELLTNLIETQIREKKASTTFWRA